MLAAAAADGSAARVLQDIAAAAAAEAAVQVPAPAEAELAQQQQEQRQQQSDGGKPGASIAAMPPAQVGEMQRDGGSVLVGGADVTEERAEGSSGWCHGRWLLCC